jgi:hypothetical protein
MTKEPVKWHGTRTKVKTAASVLAEAYVSSPNETNSCPGEVGVARKGQRNEVNTSANVEKLVAAYLNSNTDEWCFLSAQECAEAFTPLTSACIAMHGASESEFRPAQEKPCSHCEKTSFDHGDERVRTRSFAEPR